MTCVVPFVSYDKYENDQTKTTDKSTLLEIMCSTNSQFPKSPRFLSTSLMWFARRRRP